MVETTMDLNEWLRKRLRRQARTSCEAMVREFAEALMGAEADGRVRQGERSLSASYGDTFCVGPAMVEVSVCERPCRKIVTPLKQFHFQDLSRALTWPDKKRSSSFFDPELCRDHLGIVAAYLLGG